MNISNDVKTTVLTQALPYIQRYTGKSIVVNYGGGFGENVTGLMSDIALLSAINVKVVLVHRQTENVNGMLELSAAVSAAGGKAIALCVSDKEVIENMLELGYIPVVAALNNDADKIAAQIAGDIKAENIIAVTDVLGVLKDDKDESTLISEIYISDVPYLTKQGYIKDGMVDKVASCVEAMRRGVKKAFIINGAIPHAIILEMFSDEGIGTMLKGGI